jgi:3-polyprenyl-4-hydroxybenzoate decarboxylase
VKKRLIVGITGATGAVYGIGLLKALKAVASSS